MKDFKAAIEECKTKSQAIKIINQFGKKIIKDNTNDKGYFDIWIDEKTRIYKPYGHKTMRLQSWSAVTMTYSGIPVFFG